MKTGFLHLLALVLALLNAPALARADAIDSCTNNRDIGFLLSAEVMTAQSMQKLFIKRIWTKLQREYGRSLARYAALQGGRDQFREEYEALNHELVYSLYEATVEHKFANRHDSQSWARAECPSQKMKDLGTFCGNGGKRREDYSKYYFVREAEAKVEGPGEYNEQLKQFGAIYLKIETRWPIYGVKIETILDLTTGKYYGLDKLQAIDPDPPSWMKKYTMADEILKADACVRGLKAAARQPLSLRFSVPALLQKLIDDEKKALQGSSGKTQCP